MRRGAGCPDEELLAWGGQLFGIVLALDMEWESSATMRDRNSSGSMVKIVISHDVAVCL